MCLACNPGAVSLLRTIATRRAFLASAVGFSAAAVLDVGPAWAADHGDAEIIFENGPIHTMVDGAQPAEALAVRAGRILAVGTQEAVAAHRGTQTQVIDLAGRAVLPGFVEPHMHSALAVLEDWLDLTPFTTKSIDEALAKVKAAAQKAKPSDWIQAQGIDPSLMPGGPITLQMLDGAAPDNPVFILESNGHIAYANSKALAAANVTRDTQDPPQGRFVHDANGDLTGRLEEMPAFVPFMKVMPMPGPQEAIASIRRLFDKAASVGCTSMNDMGIGTMGVQDLALLEAVMKTEPPVRYSGFLTSDHMDKWVELGLTPEKNGNDRFRLKGIKFWSDGSNQARTGYQREPYLNSESRGALNYTAEQLVAGVQRAHDLGWQVAVHANGDAAIDTTLDVLETVLAKSPRSDHRHRIEHCSVLHPEQIDKMAKAGVSPSFLIGHVHFWGRAFRDEILGPDRAMLYDPCASALEGGLKISLHSDYNVTPIEPLRYVDNAVNRVMADGGEVLNPAECISVMEALKAVTIDAAWQCRMDDIVGSLEAGKYADLVVLDRNPLAVEPAEIGELKVVETWLEGKRHFEA